MIDQDTLQPAHGPHDGRPRRVPALTIVHHPDMRRIGQRALLDALEGGGVVELARTELGFAPPGKPGGQPLGDPYLSRNPIVLRARDTGVVIERGSAGSLTVDGTRVERAYPIGASELDGGVLLELSRRVLLLLHRVRPDSPVPALDLIGASDAIEEVRRAILRVADVEVPVLIRGETGAGKERVAHAIHASSKRADAPFVAVNMAAVSPTTAVSELFGHARGAFTGAAQARVGLFERAHGGTLFLDEIGATPDHIQAMLLRVLECGEVLPLGGTEPRLVDVRLVAATDADLETACAEGSFRATLLHRLAGYEVTVPPLRARLDDVARLAVAFLADELEAASEQDRRTPAAPSAPLWFPTDLMARLIRHPWPGNVRQLRNVIRQLVISSRGNPVVRIDDGVERLLRAAVVERDPSVSASIPVALGDSPSGGTRAATAQGTPTPAPAAAGRRRRGSEVGDDELLEALRAHGWAILPTANALNVARSTLYDLIERSPRIRKASDVSRDELIEAREACGGDLTEMAAQLQVSRRGLQLRLRELDDKE